MDKCETVTFFPHLAWNIVLKLYKKNEMKRKMRKKYRDVLR